MILRASAGLAGLESAGLGSAELGSAGLWSMGLNNIALWTSRGLDMISYVRLDSQLATNHTACDHPPIAILGGIYICKVRLGWVRRTACDQPTSVRTPPPHYKPWGDLHMLG